MTSRSTHIQPAPVISGVEETVVHVPRLTVKKLADKLAEIEKDQGHEIALLGVESLDYVKICHLCLEKHPDDDPHLMPSKYMILWGATDKGLDAKKHLDPFPYNTTGKEKHVLSVENLSKILAAIGWNPHFDDGLDEPTEEGDEDGTDEPEDPTVLGGTLFGALCAYIENAAPALTKELAGGTHTVAEGECLSDIAELHGIREWRLLWQLNKDALGENWDILKVGMELKLPDASSNPLADWFKENRWKDYLSPVMGYQYPGKYLSLTFVDQDDKPLVFLDAQGKQTTRPCEIYVTSPVPTLVTRTELKGGDDFDVVVPDTEDIGIWVENEAIGYGGTIWPPFDQFLAHPEDYLDADRLRPPMDLPIRRADGPSDYDGESTGSSLRGTGHEAMGAYRGARDGTHDAAQAGRGAAGQAGQASQSAQGAASQVRSLPHPGF